MTALMADGKDDLQDQGHRLERGRRPIILQHELCYADDIACFSTLLEATLRTIESNSASHWLRLTKTK
eukprot:207686-Prorocentrum_lima.AAC.1